MRIQTLHPGSSRLLREEASQKRCLSGSEDARDIIGLSDRLGIDCVRPSPDSVNGDVPDEAPKKAMEIAYNREN